MSECDFCVDERMICDKPIYIVEEHHYALLPWALIRSKLENAPLLLTFDYHTDTMEPFLRYTSHKIFGKYCADTSEEKVSERVALVKSLLASIDYNNSESVYNAISFLNHDEHICTALKSDILSSAFIISYNSNGEFPLSYECKERIESSIEIAMYHVAHNKPHPKEMINRPFNYPTSSYFISDKYPVYHDYEIDDENELYELLYKVSLEDEFIEDKFKVFGDMLKVDFREFIFSCPYILDIDLDYFTTTEAIHPKSYNFFSKIIRNATAITIAKEPDRRLCIKGVRKTLYLQAW